MISYSNPSPCRCWALKVFNIDNVFKFFHSVMGHHYYTASNLLAYNLVGNLMTVQSSVSFSDEVVGKILEIP